MSTESVNKISTTSGTGDSKIKKTIEVREIANGFIVKESKEWDDPKKGWQYETTEVYSDVNPLEAKTPDLKAIIKNNMPGS